MLALHTALGPGSAGDRTTNTRDNAWSKVLVNLYISESYDANINWTRLRDATCGERTGLVCVAFLLESSSLEIESKYTNWKKSQ